MISVVIPAYNQAAYLPETLESVLCQTEQDWECIIVNDGSTDHTEEVSLQYVEKDSRFKYFRKENGGLSDARNYGILKSSGRYILPLDSDDLIAPAYLKEAVVILENNPSVKVVYCNAELFGEKTGLWELPSYSFDWLLHSNMIFCTSMFRKSDYLQTKGYSLEMKGGFEDWDFWLSLLETGGEVHKIQETYFFYRIRTNSMVRSMDPVVERRLKLTIYKNHIDTYTKYWGTPWELYRYKEQFAGLTEGKEYKLLKALYAPVKSIRSMLKF